MSISTTNYEIPPSRNDQTNLSVVKTLGPGDKAEKSQDLGLDAQRHIQLLDDIVHAKRDAGDGPQHHHGRLESFGVVAPIIDEDLRQKLWRSATQ